MNTPHIYITQKGRHLPVSAAPVPPACLPLPPASLLLPQNMCPGRKGFGSTFITIFNVNMHATTFATCTCPTLPPSPFPLPHLLCLYTSGKVFQCHMFPSFIFLERDIVCLCVTWPCFCVFVEHTGWDRTGTCGVCDTAVPPCDLLLTFLICLSACMLGTFLKPPLTNLLNRQADSPPPPTFCLPCVPT